MVNHISFLFFTLLWYSRAISTSGIMHNYMNGNRDSSSSTHNPPPRPSPPQTSQTQQHQQHQTHQQQQQQHHQQQQHRQNGYIYFSIPVYSSQSKIGLIFVFTDIENTSCLAIDWHHYTVNGICLFWPCLCYLESFLR